MITFKDKIITVTGGVGFLGSNLCDALIKEEPKKLIIFDNLCQSSVDNVKHLTADDRVELVIADIRDYGSIEPFVLQSDYVFFLAASDVGMSINYPWTNVETNVMGMMNVLLAVKKKKDIKIIFTSSGSVVNPSTIYAISKLTGENLALFYAKEYGLKISVIRPHHVFGSRQNIFGTSGVINKFLYKILKGEPPVIWGDGSAVKCFTYVQDVVDAIILLAKDDSTIGKVYDVASETRIDINYLAKLLIERYAIDKSMQPIYTDKKLGENAELFPDTTKIKKLGWSTKFTFEQGLDITKKWVEEQI